MTAALRVIVEIDCTDEDLAGIFSGTDTFKRGRDYMLKALVIDAIQQFEENLQEDPGAESLTLRVVATERAL